MPCRSEHCSPHRREIEASRVQCLLDELDGSPLIDPAFWRGYHPDCYSKDVDVDEMTARLCSRLRDHPYVGKLSLEMQIWWRDHQKADAERERQRPGVKGNTIRTRSGLYLDYANPTVESIELSDIACGLSKVARFAGQTKYLYTVAEHSVKCAVVAQRLGMRNEILRAVLMHDAAEAYCGDITSPLKIMLPRYQEIEKSIESVIFERFNIQHFPEVKRIDLMLLKAEKSVMTSQDENHDLSGVEDLPKGIAFNYWDPVDAMAEFEHAAATLGIR